MTPERIEDLRGIYTHGSTVSSELAVRHVGDLLDALAASESARAAAEEQLAEARKEVATVWNQFRFQDAAKATAQAQVESERRGRLEAEGALKTYADPDHWWQADHVQQDPTQFDFGSVRKVWAWGDYRLPWALASEALAAAVAEGTASDS